MGKRNLISELNVSDNNIYLLHILEHILILINISKIICKKSRKLEDDKKRQDTFHKT